MRVKASGIKFGLFACFAVLFFLTGSAFADKVNYVYDNLGRLVMTVSSNGTEIIYGYDKTGHLISSTRTSGNQPPGSTSPVLTGIIPLNVFIGGEVSITITGSNLLTTDSITTDNPGIKIINFSANDYSVTIDAQIQNTVATGPATFTVTTLSGSQSISLNLISLTVSPQQIALAPGSSGSATARIQGLKGAYDLILENQSPGVISVPQSVTVPVAGNATFLIDALALGDGAVKAGNSTISVFVTNPFAGAGTASSKPVSVVVNDILQSASIVSRPVSVGVDSRYWYSTGVYASPVSVEIGPSQP